VLLLHLIVISLEYILVYIYIILMRWFSYAEEISLAKLYARKFGYREDADQELVALGAVNLFVAFFQGHPSGIK